MTEPTRPLAHPTLNDKGQWVGVSATTPKEITTRGALTAPPSRVIPVVVVPGIMGSNLRAKLNPGKDTSAALKPGAPAWRPPNGKVDGYKAANKWKGRSPKKRQQILDPSILEVDDGGEIDLPYIAFIEGLREQHVRDRGWGEIHHDSYGKLLYTLECNLNTTFFARKPDRALRPHWKNVNKFDRKSWNAPVTGLTAPLSWAEFEKFAGYHYPVYACGYNWLRSNEESAKLLKDRIKKIIAFWSSRKQTCKQVILVTHSMGGFVARACAKEIPDLIAGIVHGVMPAFGAPVCYRRIACGIETSSPGGGWIANLEMEKFADIAGATTEATTAVMATAPGVLELLPNHLYPKPWLFATGKREYPPDRDYLSLPEGSPYDMYRDTTSWYRVIDPALADPAGKYTSLPGGVEKAVQEAISQAEIFHTKILDTYYHPNSYAFYCDASSPSTYGNCRWLTYGALAGMSVNDVGKAKVIGTTTSAAGRNVELKDTSVTYFAHLAQDTGGDGTVPIQSGAGPLGSVKRVFATRGYDHQGSYNDEAMLALTQHLIVKIVQDVK